MNPHAGPLRERSNGEVYELGDRLDPPMCARAGAATPEAGTAARAPQTRTGRVLPSAAELDRALAVTQRRLEDALREIDTLRIQGAHLEQQVVLLEAMAATARQFAYHDELTGLPNRRLLLDRFNQAVARGVRRHGQVAILLADLDGFKSVNDAFGHSAGDSVLQQVATRLAGCIRASDTACRFGGDEFLILLPELGDEHAAAAVAEKIRTRVALPYFVGGEAVEMTISIGIAIYPVHGEQYTELIRRADREMYRDKAGRPGSAEAWARAAPPRAAASAEP